MRKKNNNSLFCSWTNPRFRALVYQLALVLGLVLLVYYLLSNTLDNLAQRNIKTGFDFLNAQAGFGISESLIEYSPVDTYKKAITVGLLNTLQVSIMAIVLSSIFGTIIGISRLSPNWLLNKLALIYVEVIRNIPLILQLFFWYTLVTEILPGPRQALNPIADVFLSNRGLKFPRLEGDGTVYLFIALLLAIVFAFVWSLIVKRQKKATGQQLPYFWVVTVITLLLFFVAMGCAYGQLNLNVPRLQGFNFTGGYNVSPELSALLLGLVVYTSAFVAEIVRAGIQSINQGQWEAARSIGLSRILCMRLIILPQAMRVIIPSLTSTFLNVTKNSSLAVAIAYPDLVSIVNTAINQTGQAIEGVAIIMAAYLTVSLTISFFMNWYNKRVALIER